MAVDGTHRTTTFQITEDLSASGCQYHAVAFNDGQLAANAEEASGILYNDPSTYQHGLIAIAGEMKFASGGSISAGDKLTVSTSGWFTTAGSDDGVVGESKYAVTSGSIGTGVFEFATSTDKHQNFLFDVTAADAIGAGFAYALNDNKLANNGDEHAGCAPSAITSGSAGQIVVSGICTVQVDPSDNVTIGEKLTVTTSGYYTAGDSGYWIVGMALAAIGSGATGQAYIYGGNVLEST